MLGFIFREFFEFANDRLGSSAVDAALSRCQLSSGGKYVNGGEYPPTEQVQALGEICRETGHHSRDLLLQFGEYMFTTLGNMPMPLPPTNDSFEFLEAVQEGFHGEIRTMFPGAKLPDLIHERRGPHELVLEYRSRLGLADLAEGLLIGCFRAYQENVAIEREDLEPGGKHVRFTLKRS